jgi:hypothetical protein
MSTKIEKDIAKLTESEAKDKLMELRTLAREGKNSMAKPCNPNCWDDLFRAINAALPKREQTWFKFGKFFMTKARILGYCQLWVEFQASKGNVLPDKQKKGPSHK